MMDTKNFFNHQKLAHIASTCARVVKWATSYKEFLVANRITSYIIDVMQNYQKSNFVKNPKQKIKYLRRVKLKLFELSNFAEFLSNYGREFGFHVSSEVDNLKSIAFSAMGDIDKELEYYLLNLK